MENLCQAFNLSKSFGKRKVLENINLTISEKCIHAVLGPNGAGKTTFFRILSGIIPPDSGKVLFRGQTYSRNWRKKIGYLPEIPPLYHDLTVNDYLSFIAGIYSVKTSERRDKLKKIYHELALEDFQKRLIGTLSLGNKQKVGIAQAIFLAPEIVILDEPFSGLDVFAMREVRKFLREYVVDKTIIFSSHQLSEVENICDDLSLMKRGQVVSSGTKDELLTKLSGQNTLEIEIDSKEGFLDDLASQFSFIRAIHKKEIKEHQKAELVLDNGGDRRDEIAAYIIGSGIGLYSFKQKEGLLEDFFVEFTEDHS